jgi:hypothetical protein
MGWRAEDVNWFPWGDGGRFRPIDDLTINTSPGK